MVEGSWEDWAEDAVIGIFGSIDSEVDCKCFAVGSNFVVEEGSNDWVDCPATLEYNIACCRVVSWCPQRSYESKPLYCPLASGGIHLCDVSFKSKSRSVWLGPVAEHRSYFMNTLVNGSGLEILVSIGHCLN
ncbi:hypothetical protein PIB30_069659 [Stylosanthes scabra]|uniref:Uncharacterized protein n=1 Tax=Stylosanthes scabra TaxID=79078 RepID=A0ABU6ZLX0_9FABA|nr:hypothetical protein [Stylosanthes scabra]